MSPLAPKPVSSVLLPLEYHAGRPGSRLSRVVGEPRPLGGTSASQTRLLGCSSRDRSRPRREWASCPPPPLGAARARPPPASGWACRLPQGSILEPGVLGAGPWKGGQVSAQGSLLGAGWCLHSTDSTCGAALRVGGSGWVPITSILPAHGHPCFAFSSDLGYNAAAPWRGGIFAIFV